MFIRVYDDTYTETQLMKNIQNDYKTVQFYKQSHFPK